MKRIAFAAFALSTFVFAACASPSNDLDSSVQNAAVSSEGTSAISINFNTDVANLECDFDGGDPENYSVQFDFDGKHFNSSHHIDFWGCQVDRSLLLQTAVHTGVRVHTPTAEGSIDTITVDQGKTTFTAGPTDSVTSTTTAITFTIPNEAKCQVEMGWFIDFNFEGHAFQTYGADTVDGCNGRLSQAKDDASMPATLTTETHSTYVKRTIATNDGQWSFTSYEQTTS